VSERPSDLIRQALAEALTLRLPADAVLRRFFRDHPAMGRRDRAEVADTVFDVLRNRRLYAHFAQAGDGPLEDRLVRLSQARRAVVGHAQPPAQVQRSGPKRMSGSDGSTEPEWLERIDAANLESLPAAVALSLPDWLYEKLLLRFGEAETQALGRAMLVPASLHLRANTLKTRVDALIERLRSEGIDARAFDSVPGAIEVAGHPALERSAAFADGAFEVQDAGSQLLALLVGARRGQKIIDLCAGAGGKTLALAAAMNSLGQVFACDVSLSRLQRLRPRLTRSGATNVQPFAIDSLSDRKLARLAGRADAVLVDAPCTGTGTLRRNPDLKWRFGPEDLLRLREEQQAILRAAALLVAPGGVLVYATCSLLAEENEHQADWFEGLHPEFVREDASAVLASSGAKLPEDAFRSGALVCLPHRHGTDAFFGVRWRRAKPASKQGAVAGASG
jgi:16S rRNA (cytosine967-C5)-methyltransferase